MPGWPAAMFAMPSISSNAQRDPATVHEAGRALVRRAERARARRPGRAVDLVVDLPVEAGRERARLADDR